MHRTEPALSATRSSDELHDDSRQLTALLAMADCEAQVQPWSAAGVHTLEIADERQGICVGRRRAGR